MRPAASSASPSTGLELRDQVALRRAPARVVERGLEQRERRRGVAAVQRQLAEELAGQRRLAQRAHRQRQLERAPEVLLGALELPAPAREQPGRQQRRGLALQVAGLAARS